MDDGQEALVSQRHPFGTPKMPFSSDQRSSLRTRSSRQLPVRRHGLGAAAPPRSRAGIARPARRLMSRLMPAQWVSRRSLRTGTPAPGCRASCRRRREAVLHIPQRALPDARHPGGQGLLGIVRMQQAEPAEVRTLGLSHAHQRGRTRWYRCFGHPARTPTRHR
jgi:hypothetical protein